MKNALEKLCEAIAYPDAIPDDATTTTLRVDGDDIQARLVGKRLVLSRVLLRDEKDLPQFAAYAAGRLLKENAVLAWDEKDAACVLWQAIDEQASTAQLMYFFEAFMNSCDWWVARVNALNAPPVILSDMVIRP